jgi:hypothetical protein
MNLEPLKKNGSFELSEKRDLLKVFNSIEAAALDVPQTAMTALTDNSTGTATSTLAAITSTTPADLAAVGVQLGIIKNAIASLAGKINTLRTDLITAGVLE